MGLGTLTILSMLWAPGQALPPDVVPFNQAQLKFPINYKRKNEIRELLLYVSTNQGGTWEQAFAANPDRDTVFNYTAPVDGTYWFQIVVVDKQGRKDPADPNHAPTPPMKVLIDTKRPAVAIRSLERVGDEATVAWTIQDANPDWSKFQIDYRVGDSSWQKVNAQAGPAGSARFRIEQVGQLTVRVQACDLVGNRGEAVREAGPSGPAIASTPNSTEQASLRIGQPEDVPPPMINPSEAMIGAPLVLPPAEPLGASTQAPQRPVTPPAANDPLRNDGDSPLAVSPGSAPPASGAPLAPAQIVNVARFDVAYDVDQKGPSGISKAEVWVTRDEGKSWQRWSTCDKPESPLTVDLAQRNNPQVEGIYGLKIVLHSGAGLSKGPPVAGEAPDMRVDVDLTPPVVKIYEPIPDPSQKDTLILRWQAVDRNLANEPITLEWAEQPEGPWNPVVAADGSSPLGSSAPMPAKRLPNSGQFSWKLPHSFPTHRAYLRVTARDMAGNVAEAHTPHPILVDMNKPVAKIHGIIGAAATERR